MKFAQLGQDYQDDVLADALYARELEWFHYDFDRGNYERMLGGQLDADKRADLQRRIKETEAQMAFVEQIYDALAARITDPGRHAAAIARVTAKREAAK